MAKTTGRPSRFLVEVALRRGATRAKVISTKDIFVDERVRLKCLVPRCENYGHHLMCPPNTLDVAEFRKIVKAYSYALLVQVDAPYDSSDQKGTSLGRRAREGRTGGPGKKQERILHDIVNEMERYAFKEGYYLAAGLVGSDCSLCGSCVGVEKRGGCRHPFEARPSMQSLGIDVIRTCGRAGMPIRLSSKEPVRWTGLVLLV